MFFNIVKIGKEPNKKRYNRVVLVKVESGQMIKIMVGRNS